MFTKEALPCEGTTADSKSDAGQVISAANRPQGTFDVDANGQAVYRIPIEVPPGIAGCQPHLELAYSHRQHNSVMGVGWGLSGLSAITRTKATYAVDGFNDAVSYDDNDRYALDGQRLINIQGEYGQAGTVYYTELQSWKQIVAAASPAEGFTVTTKSGEVWQYGATPDSLILASGGPQVRVWALSSITDRNGNSVGYGYTQTPLLADGSRGAADAGAYYIDLISYTTGNGATANRFVQFTYATRPDPITNFVGGYPVMMSYLMTNITTYLAGNNLARSYALNYLTSQATQLSCLQSITESGADGVSTLPSTTMTWQDIPTPGFEIGPSSQLNQHLNAVGVQQMDVSGSGLTDIVQLWLDPSGALNATTYLATPGTGGTTFVFAADSLLDSFPQTRKILPVDIDGNGLTDLLIAYKGSNGNLMLAVFLSNGSGFEAAPANPFDTGDSWNDAPTHLQFFAMDANGDGRTDLVEAYAHNDPVQGNLLYFRTYLSNFGNPSGAMFTEAIISPTGDPANPTQPLAFWAMDVNGDGMKDLVRIWQRGSDSHVIATAYISASTALDNVSFATQVTTDLGLLSLANQIAFLPVDVNGDGIQDLLQVWQETDMSGSTLHLTTFLCNAAGGFVAGPDSPFPNLTLTSGDFYPMGFNGGGQAALVSKWISGSDELMFTVFPASPSGTFRLGTTFDAGVAGSAVLNASFFPGDVNGDGKADLIRMSLDENQQPLLVPYISSGAYPDLVDTITNPLGGVVNIKYLPLSDPSVYSRGDASAFPKANGLRFPHPLTPTQFPAQAVLGQATYVVSGYSQSNNSSLNRFEYESVYAMSYSGAQLNLLGRGWEGFQTVSKLDQKCGRNIIQTYNQDFPYTGTMASMQTEADGSYATDPRVPKNESAVLLSIASSQFQSFQRAAGATGLNPPVFEVLTTASRLERYDYGAAQFDFATAQTYVYDDFGNQTLHAQLGYVDTSGDPLFPAEVVYRHNLYQNDASGWVLGLLLYAKVTANAIDADITHFLSGDYQLEHRTYTDQTCNLATQGKWDNVNGVYLVTGYGYSAFGNRISETTPGGFTTQYDFDPVYNTYRMQTTSPATQGGKSLSTIYGYDPRFGSEVACMDANGTVSITGLDAFGRKAFRQVTMPPITGAQGDLNGLTPLVTGAQQFSQPLLMAVVVTVEATNYLNDGQGGCYTEVQSLQQFPTDSTRDFIWEQKYLDGLGRERETIVQSGQSAGNIITLKDYDPDGRTVRQSLPFFSPTPIISGPSCAILTTYDVLERPLTQRLPVGADGNEFSTTAWVYGTGGQETKTSASGANESYVQVSVHHFYDGQDKVVQVVVPGDNNATTAFVYDAIARLTNAIDPATLSNPQGVSNTISYDSLNRKLTFDNPDQNTTNNPNIKAMTYAFDPLTGRLRQQTNAAGEVTAFTYDSLERITSKTLSDGRVFNYSYDDPTVNGMGRLTQVMVEAGNQGVQSQYDFSYDAYGNASMTTLNVVVGSILTPFVTSSIFDPQGRVVQQTLPDGSVLNRAYSFGHLLSQTLDGARVDYPLEGYAPSGRASSVIYGQGILPGTGVVSVDLTLNPASQVYAEVVSNPMGEVLNLSYGYDLLNQLLEVNDQSGSGQTQSFTYINKRLATAAVPDFNPATYEYDASGNIMSKDGVSYICQAHFPSSGTANGEVVYSATPDACGRTLTRTVNGQEITFAYDGLGLLCSASASGEMIREMVSDYLGRCLIQTDADGTQKLFISQAYQVVIPPQGAASITKYLLDDRGTVASITTGTTPGILYFRRDHKGSATHSFGSDGMVVSQIAYGGYGQSLTVSGTGDFQPTYEQRSWNAAIGLYYFEARYYDPMTGRFLTPDSQLGASNHLRADVLNRYAFELNNPVNLVDLDGHGLRDVLIGIGIGIALIGIGAAIVLTGGAAAPLGAIAAGALLGAGLNAGIYAATHTDQSAGTFYKGFVADAAVGALVGGVTGGMSAGVGSLAEAASARAVAGMAEGWGARATLFAVRAAIYMPTGAAMGAGGDAFNQYMSNVIDRDIGGEDVSLDSGVNRAAITGAIVGSVAGLGQTSAEAATVRIGRRSFAEAVQAEANEETGLFRLRTVAKDTIKTRAILFGISESSAIADASLEATGY